MSLLALLGKVLFFGLLATILAAVEIESEGKYGWAEKAPTWFRTRGLAARIYGMLMGGKPLTGYHAFMFFLPALIFHVQFFMGVSWSLEAELLALAAYFCVCPLWDYYWFVLNPYYAGRFRKENVWWHAKSYWVGGLFPVDYLVGFVISLAMASGAAWRAGSSSHVVEHLILMCGLAAFTGALHLMSPAYVRWYWNMRKRDDRDQAPIFHRD